MTFSSHIFFLLKYYYSCVNPYRLEGASLLWVDKYKPTQMKQIVGQSGDKSNANKLKRWLMNWRANNAPDAPKKSLY